MAYLWKDLKDITEEKAEEEKDKEEEASEEDDEYVRDKEDDEDEDQTWWRLDFDYHTEFYDATDFLDYLAQRLDTSYNRGTGDSHATFRVCGKDNIRYIEEHKEKYQAFQKKKDKRPRFGQYVVLFHVWLTLRCSCSDSRHTLIQSFSQNATQSSSQQSVDEKGALPLEVYFHRRPKNTKAEAKVDDQDDNMQELNDVNDKFDGVGSKRKKKASGSQAGLKTAKTEKKKKKDPWKVAPFHQYTSEQESVRYDDTFWLRPMDSTYRLELLHEMSFQHHWNLEWDTQVKTYKEKDILRWDEIRKAVLGRNSKRREEDMDGIFPKKLEVEEFSEANYVQIIDPFRGILAIQAPMVCYHRHCLNPFSYFCSVGLWKVHGPSNLYDC